VTDVELACCDSATRSSTTRLGFALLLKTYQRLGYFVTSEQVPNAIAEHVASSMGEPYDRENLRQYDVSQARRKHLSAVREFLAVKPFGDDGKALMRQTFAEAALTKEDVIDIINIGIETLVRHRYELPAFDTLLREARIERIATNQALYTQIHDALGDAGRIFLDKLFVVGDDPRRVSPWNDIKQDAAKPTIDGMRDLVERYDRLTELACHADLLKTIPVIKIKQWALEGNSLDASFERSLAFMLENCQRQSEWLTLKGKGKIALTVDDLDWIPEKWWKLVTGEFKRDVVPTRINRRQFEVCVCLQMVRELKSGDLCVIGSDAYSDHRNELVPMDECERTRADYGEKVGLPVESSAFIKHIRSLLTESAQQADKTFQDNPYFKIVDGRPKLGRQEKKETPSGFKQLDDALRRKLDGMGLSLLDVLADTMKWIGWGKHFGPLSGHQGKLLEADRRKILTVFAYGTGLGPTQIAKNQCASSVVRQSTPSYDGETGSRYLYDD